MSPWVDDKVVPLLTGHFSEARGGWTRNVEAAVQRGLLKRAYFVGGPGSHMQSIVSSLQARLAACTIRIVVSRPAYTLIKVTYVGPQTKEAA